MDPREAGLSTSESEADLTQGELAQIGKKIAGDWQMVARFTWKFEHHELVNIRRHRSLHDDVEKGTEMLNIYESKNGSRDLLASALEQNGRHDIAEDVRSKYYQTTVGKGTQVSSKEKEHQEGEAGFQEDFTKLNIRDGS